MEWEAKKPNIYIQRESERDSKRNTLSMTPMALFAQSHTTGSTSPTVSFHTHEYLTTFGSPFPFVLYRYNRHSYHIALTLLARAHPYIVPHFENVLFGFSRYLVWRPCLLAFVSFTQFIMWGAGGGWGGEGAPHRPTTDGNHIHLVKMEYHPLSPLVHLGKPG